MTYGYKGEIREVRTCWVFGKERHEQRENKVSERKNGNLKLKTTETGRRTYGIAICEKSETPGYSTYVDIEMEKKIWDEKKWTEKTKKECTVL